MALTIFWHFILGLNINSFIWKIDWRGLDDEDRRFG